MLSSITTTPATTVNLDSINNSSLVNSNKQAAENNPELRSAFDSLVGETFFGQLIKSMRKTVGKSAYFNGGRAEEIFQQQLDQTIAQKISETSAEKFSGPMYDLFTLQRK